MLSEYKTKFAVLSVLVVSPFILPITLEKSPVAVLRKYKKPPILAEGLVLKVIIPSFGQDIFHSVRGDSKESFLSRPFGFAVKPETLSLLFIK